MKWNKILIVAVLFGLTFSAEPAVQANPGVIVDQYDYQEDNMAIAYPHFDGMLKESAQTKMNDAIETIVEKFVADAHTRIERANQDNTHYFRPEAQLKYKVWYNAEGLVSITLNTYEFYGGAHGMSTLTGYTFNLKTGEIIPYDDLFKWDADSREIAYQKMRKQVNERKIFLFPEGQQNRLFIRINEPDYMPNYYLTEQDQAVIIFQQYEVAPYAAGILQFKM